MEENDGRSSVNSGIGEEERNIPVKENRIPVRIPVVRSGSRIGPSKK